MTTPYPGWQPAAGLGAGAGWYSDPAGTGLLRYWDGYVWTEHVAPPPTGLVPASPPPVPWAGGYPGQRKTNGLAVASLVLSIAGLFTYGLGFVLAVIFGHVALSQITRSGNTEDGRGLALAGLVIGYIGLSVMVLLLVSLMSLI